MSNPFRITLRDTVKDARGTTFKNKAKDKGYNIKELRTAECYLVNKKFDQKSKQDITQMLTNPVFESAVLDHSNAPRSFDYAVEIGFLPGVTDNLGATVREAIEDKTKETFDYPIENVFSSTL